MNYETIIFDREDNFALLTLNRPESLNALNSKLIEELGKAADEIAADNSIRSVVITGSGRAFCVGADLKEIMSPEGAAFHKQFAGSKPQTFFNKIESLEKPVIAAINGPAVGGGCELALVCDLRIAATTAMFGLAEIKIGVIPAGGGTARLPRLIGATKAKEMLLFGDSVDANEAFRIGLINKVVQPESVLDEAKKWAKELSMRPPLALRATKLCVNAGMQMPLSGALDLEAKEATDLFNSEDRHEGVNAFLEKRQPVFKGK